MSFIAAIIGAACAFDAKKDSGAAIVSELTPYDKSSKKNLQILHFFC